jgi:hypothetical protein
MNPLWLVPLLAALQASGRDSEHVFQLRDGSILRGVIVEAAGLNLKIRSRSLGEVAIEREELLAIDGRSDFALRSPEKLDEDRIDPHGTVTSRCTWIDRNSTARPLSTYRFLAEGTLLRVTDPLGLALDVTREALGDLTRCTVTLPTPVPPGETFTLVLESRREQAVIAREGSLVFEAVVLPDQALTFRRTVTLPQGAVIERVSPPPADESDGTVVWQGKLAPGETFRPTIVYRLP